MSEDKENEYEYVSEEDSDSTDIENPLIQLFGLLGINQEDCDFVTKLNWAEFPNPKEWVTDDNNNPIHASVGQLIIYLTDPNAANIDFQNMFLTTFPSYVTPEIVASALYARYFANLCDSRFPQENLKNIRNRVVRIFTQWLKIAPFHFNDRVRESVKRFSEILGIEKDHDPTKAKQFGAHRDIINGSLSTQNKIISYREKAPEPIPPQFPFNLEDVEAVEMARQMTLKHSETFRAIHASELLTAIWGEEKGGGAEHVNQLTEEYNAISEYVTRSVINPPDVKRRGRVFKHWIDVAEFLYEMQNFHGVFAVMFGLQHKAVQRMTQTMKFAMKTNSTRKKNYEKLKEFIDISNDYKNYRAIVETAIEPCVPFIGCLSRDLIYIQEKFPNKVDGLINFQKSEQCYRLICQVRKFQNEGYNFETINEVQEAFTMLPEPLSLIELMKFSQSREAKSK